MAANSAFIESLKRLYKAGKITKKKLKSMVDSGTITQEQFDEIIAGK